MYLRRDESKRTARAPAKLNLYLEVTGRRSDGFHDVETLVVPVRLYDSVALTPTPCRSDGSPGQILLAVHDGLPVRRPPQPVNAPSDESNLVVRALKLLQERSNCRLGADVALVKRIPIAAGLGGGSSDAAAALRLANRAWELDWPVERLREVAAELGSDVPFFLAGGAAICRGRGERVEPLAGVPTLHFVLVKPPAGLSTSEVYRAHDELSAPRAPRTNFPESLTASGPLVWKDLARWMHNRLQAAAASLAPWVDEARSAFGALDFVAHQLSGSGSAYFGVCRHAQHARRLATILRTRQLGLVYATRSCQ